MSLQTQTGLAGEDPSPAIGVVYRVCVSPGGWSYPCQPNETVLHAAWRAGVELPSSCRNGTCRTCLCQLQSGSVGYTIEWPGVSSDEKGEGYFLPCVAYARSDLSIAQPDAARISLPDAPNSPSPSTDSD